MVKKSLILCVARIVPTFNMGSEAKRSGVVLHPAPKTILRRLLQLHQPQVF